MKVEVDGIALQGQQLQCFDSIMEKIEKNEKFHLAVLGLSGTGKTVLLKAIKSAVGTKYGPEKCLATACVSTAAELIGAKTIESTFLLSWLSEEDSYPHRPEKIAQMHEQLSSVKLLLIDNIQFVGANTFMNMNREFQVAFNNKEPFGGISVVCFGDLFQLHRPSEPKIFQSELWAQFKLRELVDNYKIESKEELAILTAIALGATEEIKKFLRGHCQMEGRGVDNVAKEMRSLKTENPEGTFAAIAPTNILVGDVQEALRNPDTPSRTYCPLNKRNDLHGRDDHYFYSGERSDIDLMVYLGCSVRLEINMEEELLHGSIGTVESFDENVITVRFGNIKKHICRVGWFCVNVGWDQFPLLLVENAYSYQRSQGLSFDGVIMVRSKHWHSVPLVMEGGFFYSAISRARSLKNCRIYPMEPLYWKVPEGAIEEMARIREANNQE